jgi:L-2-hydroxycarboxylate dehydrogenase (NAD+)
MSETFYVVPIDQHNALVEAAYAHRHFNPDECRAAAKFSAYASWHGIRTHNAIKALHLDDHFGSKSKGCVPNAKIEKRATGFAASQIWNANRKLGQATAYEAMEAAIAMADKYGIGQVSVDNAFHYLWGGGYVMEAAQKGYIAYTNCTAALAEVVPFMGKYPTLGTNPHSWGFPTTEAIGFPLVIDWATSVVAMGRVQQFQREGTQLPPDAAVDNSGQMTTDPNQVAALTTFGKHKGYGLSIINEVVAAFIGGSLPTIRSRWGQAENEKHTPAFYFQVMHPEAINGNGFALGRTQTENVKVVLEDIIGHGNDQCLLPGQIEADAAKRSEANDGLLFSLAEINAFNEIANECGQSTWDHNKLELAK